MNNYNNKNPLFYKGLIYCFAALYLLVAFISFWHCIAFCLVGNPLWISVMMSFAFEVGLAATLFSVLTTDNKNTYVAWILMTFLTFVQVIGNVYSVYKYMVETGTNFYVYIQESMLHWFVEDVSQQDIMSIISIILGALLPIVALLMTAMVSNNLKLWLTGKQKEKEVPPSAPIPDNEFANVQEVPAEEVIEELPEKSPFVEDIKDEVKKEEEPKDYSSESTDFSTDENYDLDLGDTEPQDNTAENQAEIVSEPVVGALDRQPITIQDETNYDPENDEPGDVSEEAPESVPSEEDGTVEEVEETREPESDLQDRERVEEPVLNPFNIDTKPLEDTVKNNIGMIKKGPFTVFTPRK